MTKRPYPFSDNLNPQLKTHVSDLDKEKQCPATLQTLGEKTFAMLFSAMKSRNKDTCKNNNNKEVQVLQINYENMCYGCDLPLYKLLECWLCQKYMCDSCKVLCQECNRLFCENCMARMSVGVNKNSVTICNTCIR